MARRKKTLTSVRLCCNLCDPVRYFKNTSGLTQHHNSWHSHPDVFKTVSVAMSRPLPVAGVSEIIDEDVDLEDDGWMAELSYSMHDMSIEGA